MQPNVLAYIALFGWPVVSAYLFLSQPLQRAIIWSVFLAYLFLPSGFGIDLPGIPALTKISVANLSLMVLVIFVAAKQARRLPTSPWARVLIIMLIIGPFITALLNPDDSWSGARLLPGLSAADAVSSLAGSLITIIPFLIGFSFLADEDAQKELLKALITVAFVYSAFVLIEVRMSPQFHTWIYGYFPHSFAQQIRDGGFRPVVFTNHGLAVGFFMATAVIASAVMWRHLTDQAAGLYRLATGYFFVVLVLCKSLASIFYGGAAIALVLLLKPRKQLMFCLALVMLSLSYPALRTLDLVPTEAITEMFAAINDQRAGSLNFRFENEDLLLERANERPVFGWGGWGRARIYSDTLGKDISVTDGRWVILFGQGGWVEFIAFFGLLALPVISLARLPRSRGAEMVGPVTTGLCLLLSFKMLDLLPNAELPTWTMLIAGSLMGYAEKARQPRVDAAVTHVPPAQAKPRTIL